MKTQHPKLDAKVSKKELTDHIVRYHLTAWEARRDQRPFRMMSPKAIREVHDWLDRDSLLDKTPRKFRNVMGGGDIVCRCGNDLWIEHPRSLDYYNLECSRCHCYVSPLTETGASR